MSDPLLDKMDALLKKHRGDDTPPASGERPAPPETDAPPPLPEDAWLPVLTEVVVKGDPDATPIPEAVPAAETAVEPPPPQVSEKPEPAQADPAMLVERIMAELEPRLNSLLRDRLILEIRNSLDDSLSTLLAQMDVHIREIVREAVAEQLDNP